RAQQCQNFQETRKSIDDEAAVKRLHSPRRLQGDEQCGNQQNNDRSNIDDTDCSFTTRGPKQQKRKRSRKNKELRQNWTERWKRQGHGTPPISMAAFFIGPTAACA